ncbi:hypothetical protein L226DRAFT_473849 [Lentinus tigrinus ALCF2SS1-7]|uniref:Uncharacterized protein n=1 Tax=Lentinus tigrinus ALCF2SS1-6 TaxID=1328759 RepID=A0A5C2RMS0_9APHY|nr:hypothetical protein L227DRAFT_514042 [Lentinus tigrinus ALCF2SS1-6]RPD68195.1 hypothetical protein L226DRAFT_473849 [Lentinus tigrinus ALCF2SS1-7]
MNSLSQPLQESSCTYLEFGLSGMMHAMTTCIPTIILTINVGVGDAIVWWRVLAIWPDSLIVKVACVIFIQATLCDDSCPASVFGVLTPANLKVVPAGTMFEQDLYGLTASVLSLASNLVATALIWCKAWEHRKFIASVSLGRSSRVEKVLALLVESGTVYCVLWAVIVGYQVIWQVQDGDVYSTLQTYMDYFMKGCLIPLVGMYPTAIILLVALNKSHFEGTTLGTIATPHLSFRRPSSSQDSVGDTCDDPHRLRSIRWPGQAQIPWESVESTVLAESKRGSVHAVRDEETAGVTVQVRPSSLPSMPPRADSWDLSRPHSLR